MKIPKLGGKREKKSKEQIAAEMKQRQAWERQKDIAKNSLFPGLVKHTRSIAHAEQVCEILRTVILAQMNKHWEGKLIGDLGLLDELAKDTKAIQPEMYQDILFSLEDVPISEAMRVLEILGKVIGAHTQNMVMKMKLSDIPVDELIN